MSTNGTASRQRSKRQKSETERAQRRADVADSAAHDARHASNDAADRRERRGTETVAKLREISQVIERRARTTASSVLVRPPTSDWIVPRAELMAGCDGQRGRRSIDAR